MVGIIIRRSEREIREAAHAVPAAFRGKVSGFARDLEEADRFKRETGRDRPGAKPVYALDTEAAKSTHRRLRRMGLPVED